MTKTTMIRNYRKFTAAEGYIIGFSRGDDVYMARIDSIPPRYQTIMRECAKAHHQMGLYINAHTKAVQDDLLRRGAVRVCSVSDLDALQDTDKKHSRGVLFERFVYLLNGQKIRPKDRTPFYEAGDIELDGKQIQVKYMHARICYENTLKKLQKGA